MISGVDHISSERVRQVVQERFDSDHDDEHADNELANAAICYAAQPAGLEAIGIADSVWPWGPEAWHPSPDDRIRELRIAGALLAAEIDRLERVAARAAE